MSFLGLEEFGQPSTDDLVIVHYEDSDHLDIFAAFASGRSFLLTRHR
jgi:hypothetical protein